MRKNLKNWAKENKLTLGKIAQDLNITSSLLSEVSSGKKYLSPEVALKLEEYTKKINPNDYIKATDLINPKKLKEFELIAKVK